jgi:hypothetical protein
MATRAELLEAVRERYESARPAERRRILDEFTAVSGYHRKHAIRLLRLPAGSSAPDRRGRSPVYDAAVQTVLVVVWEASDRICGKRLKALFPVLVPAMERHGHLALDATVRSRLLAMSASTIDRLLRRVRAQSGAGRRRSGVTNAIRRSVRVRTFSDWGEPPPGFMEMDLVAHSGPSLAGTFAWTLVLTDVATGWTECVPLPCRDSALVIEALTRLRGVLPFPLKGADFDNDSVFMNEEVVGWCRANGIEVTRARAYRKNDQAWVEQKNGAVVRRLVGHDRLEGLGAVDELNRLYATARLFVNFFQPSFKLAAKQREGAKVSRQYHAPATPYARLLAAGKLAPEVKERLEAEFTALDPIALLAAVRGSQERIASLAVNGGNADLLAPASDSGLAGFLSGLGTAWQAGEVRATHRAKPKARRYWRSRADPFGEVAGDLRSWLEAEPNLQATDLLMRLQAACPGRYPDKLLRTLQRRTRAWRREIAHQLVFGPYGSKAGRATNEGASMPDVAVPGSLATVRLPVDLMDDAGASPTAPQAPLQPQATMIAR